MTMKPSTQDALALAQSIVQGQTTAQAALQASLQAVARLNPQVNAIDTQAPEAALRRAQALDAELAALRTDSQRAALLEERPFFGVPLPLKDLGLACVDLPSSMGSAFFFGSPRLIETASSCVAITRRASCPLRAAPARNSA